MTERAEVGAGVADVDMSGRTVLVTGATSGIGRETALALGRLGARVLVHGRDRERGAAVADALAAVGADAAFHRADFASLDAVRGLADAVRADGDGLDVLVNNAGGYFTDGRLTDAGVEYTFAVNHLAPFLLTNLLAPTLERAGGRVVTVSSEAHRAAGSLSLAGLRDVADYAGWEAYCRSKLANVLFVRELARRYDAGPANALHPGTVPGSAFFRHLPGPVRAALGVYAALPEPLQVFTKSVAEGAETSVYLAASPDARDVTGEYFEDCGVATPSRAARDDRAARRLWAWSVEAAGLEPEAVVGDGGE
jgi:NAD(P)-dependent dehydrogenase (short-subunit alcohol dehydrogenase family)